jgi:hypothetical protein
MHPDFSQPGDPARQDVGWRSSQEVPALAKTLVRSEGRAGRVVPSNRLAQQSAFLVAAREAEPSLRLAVACGLIVLGAATATWASQRTASA